MRRRLFTGATIPLVLSTCFALACVADEPGPATADLPPFHRVFMPEKEIEERDWKQRYLPVNVDEFEKDLQTVANGVRGVPTAQRARLERAEYRARIVNEDVLVGTGALSLTLQDKQEKTLLSLTPCELAIHSAKWVAPAQPAVIGAGPNGDLQLLVEGNELVWNWSRRGERTASGAVQFQLSVPSCPMTRLELTVPSGAEVVASRGVVSRSQVETETTCDWVVELGGENEVELRIVPEETNRDRRPLTLLRQTATYEFSARGVDVAAQFRLDIHGEPLERLQVDLDPGLHLIGVKFGDLQVPWSATTDLETGQAHVHLEFPEPLSGTGRVLQLTAVAPLTTGRRFLLPRIQPQGVAWQEGRADLIVPKTLILEQLETTGCRQSRITSLPAPLSGESIEVQNYESSATVEVQLAEPRKAIRLSHAAVIEVDASAIKQRCTVAIGSDERRQKLSLPVRDGWVIDSVDNSLPGRTVKWDVRDTADHRSELQIDYPEAGRPVVVGHHARNTEETISADQLRMLEFAGFPGGDGFVSVQAAEGLELRWDGNETLRRIDTASLDTEQLGLFPRLPEGQLYADDVHLTQATLTVMRRRPSFSADIHLDVAVQDRTLSETVTILCTPDAVRVERLLIHVSQNRDAPLEWRLAGGNNSGQFSARKLSAGEQAKAGLQTRGEVWELLLQLTRPGVFELRGQRKVPFVDDTAVALVSVDGATSQRGTLAIRALGDTGLNITNAGLMSVPAELLDEEHYQTARATFHYQPAGDDLENEPLVRLSPAKPQQADTGAWVWSVQLSSRYANDGPAMHQATLFVETAGRRSVNMELPVGASLHEAWINADRTLPQDLTKPTFALPAGRRRATITLRYSTVAHLPTVTSTEIAPFPTIDLPIGRREWQVWLPPEFQVTHTSGHDFFAQPVGPSWSERLFGPFGRSADNQIFNPLVMTDWHWVFGATRDVELARTAQRQFVQGLGALAADYVDGEELTYGQLLAAASEAEAQRGRVLLVDSAGMVDAKITPQTRLPDIGNGTPFEIGGQLLRQERLVAIATPFGVLLTNVARAGLYESQLDPGVVEDSTSIATGRLEEVILRASTGGRMGGIQTVDLWRADRVGESETWIKPPTIPFADIDPRSWHCRILECSVNEPETLSVVHVARLRSFFWGVLLAVLGVGLWKPIVGVRGLILVAGISGAAALVAPVPIVLVCSAVFIGALTSLAFRVAYVDPGDQPPAESPPESPSRVRSSVGRMLTAPMLLLAVIHFAAAIDAAEPKNTAKQLPHAVLVPIDSDQNPVGDKYYVPDEFYAELLRRTAEVSGALRGWVTCRGTFEGALVRDPVTSRLDLSRLKTRFELEVFQSNLSVLLPLPKDSWGEAIRAVRLDGRTLRPQWTAAGDALELGNLIVGSHVLEVDVLPPLQTELRRQGFDLAIPRLGQASLDLSFPQDLTSVDVPSAPGAVVTEPTGGKLHAELGASNRLSVRWPAGETVNAAPSDLEVDELLWIKVRPGTTVLDARFRFRGLSGRVRTLRLLADARLRLLSSPQSSSELMAHTIPGDPQQIELEFPQGASDAATVDLSFLVNGASGVGSLRLPRLESIDAKTGLRWLGMSVDASLQHRVQAGEESRAIDVGEFLAAWGPSDAKPLQAFSIPRGEPIWFLATQPAKPQTSIEQSTSIGLGSKSSIVQLDAEISISGGVLTQLNINGPPDFSVDSVSVREQDVERVARWASDDTGRISVFLTAQIEGKQQLLLKGRWPQPTGPTLHVPVFNVDGSTITRRQLRLYRQPGVLATVTPLPGSVPLTDQQTPRDEVLGASCGSFTLLDDKATVEVALGENNPTTKGTCVTFLKREGNQWTAELQYQIDVQDGLADSLQFEIPPQWSEPFRSEPAADLAVATTAREQRKQLTLTPPRPLTGKHTYIIRGRVAPSPGDRLSVPDIRPLHVEELQRFVALPRVFESQQVAWDWLHLAPARLPAELVPRDWLPDQTTVYQVTGEHFQASLKAVQRERSAATVMLADIQLAWLPGNRYLASAAFDVEPGGAKQCILQMPVGSEIVHLAVEQLPTSLSPAGPDRFHVSLGPEQLPQRIEVLFQGPWREASSMKIEPPRLVGLSVEKTVWTVYSPPTVEAIVAQDAANGLPESELQLIRLESVVDSLQLPAEVVGEHLPEEIARWYDTWRKRYWTARTELRHDLIAARRDTPQSEESITAGQLDREMSGMDRRLGTALAGMPSPVTGDIAARLVANVSSQSQPHYFESLSPGGELDLRIVNQRKERGVLRWMYAGSLLIFSSVVFWRANELRVPQITPWTILGAVAFAWWLFLSPSILGLIVLVAVGVVTIFTRWSAST